MTYGGSGSFICPMNQVKNTASQLTIWVLLDDRAGNRSQCLGVASALRQSFEVRDIRYNALSTLPNFVKGVSFLGLTADSTHALRAPWPDLIITAGRRTAGVARAIKRQSRGHTKIVQIMYPGKLGISDFDLVAVPNHDRTRIGENILTIFGAPHGVNQDILSTARAEWMPSFEDLPGPRIAVFVGGSTRRKSFSTNMAASLGRAINDLAKNEGGSLMISTSRRTGDSAAAVLAEIDVPHVTYQWNDAGRNPYHGYLACADAIVVSGDSVSMCSESCATTKPVYIYSPPGFVVDKHARLHQVLYEGGYARPLGEAYSCWTHPPLNAATEIADSIRKLMELS